MVPLPAPKHVISVALTTEIEGAELLLTVVETVLVQPFASRTITL